jgi:3-oxoacyl-[acyl-carrier protein] reductase
VARDGITVNSVCPGFTATERLDELARAVAQRQGVSPEAVMSGWAGRTPVARLLEPEEVAAAVAFLCSARPSGIDRRRLPVGRRRAHRVSCDRWLTAR